MCTSCHGSMSLTSLPVRRQPGRKPARGSGSDSDESPKDIRAPVPHTFEVLLDTTSGGTISWGSSLQMINVDGAELGGDDGAQTLKEQSPMCVVVALSQGSWRVVQLGLGAAQAPNAARAARGIEEVSKARWFTQVGGRFQTSRGAEEVHVLLREGSRKGSEIRVPAGRFFVKPLVKHLRRSLRVRPRDGGAPAGAAPLALHGRAVTITVLVDAPAPRQGVGAGSSGGDGGRATLEGLCRAASRKWHDAHVQVVDVAERLRIDTNAASLYSRYLRAQDRSLRASKGGRAGAVAATNATRIAGGRTTVHVADPLMPLPAGGSPDEARDVHAHDVTRQLVHAVLGADVRHNGGAPHLSRDVIVAALKGATTQVLGRLEAVGSNAVDTSARSDGVARLVRAAIARKHEAAKHAQSASHEAVMQARRDAAGFVLRDRHARADNLSKMRGSDIRDSQHTHLVHTAHHVVRELTEKSFAAFRRLPCVARERTPQQAVAFVGFQAMLFRWARAKAETLWPQSGSFDREEGARAPAPRSAPNTPVNTATRVLKLLRKRHAAVVSTEEARGVYTALRMRRLPILVPAELSSPTERSDLHKMLREHVLDRAALAIPYEELGGWMWRCRDFVAACMRLYATMLAAPHSTSWRLDVHSLPDDPPGADDRDTHVPHVLEPVVRFDKGRHNVVGEYKSSRADDMLILVPGVVHHRAGRSRFADMPALGYASTYSRRHGGHSEGASAGAGASGGHGRGGDPLPVKSRNIDTDALVKAGRDVKRGLDRDRQRAPVRARGGQPAQARPRRADRIAKDSVRPERAARPGAQ